MTDLTLTMKIILSTTFLVAIFVTGLLGINNAFAQGDEAMVEANETGLVNSTGMLNATLAFAQEGFQTEDLVNETIDIGNNTATTANATLAYAAEHGSKIGEEYRKMGEHIGKEFKKMGEGNEEKYKEMGENIGKEFENIEKGTTTTTNTMNKNSTTTIMNATLPIPILGNILLDLN
jgi:hypothetical protein